MEYSKMSQVFTCTFVFAIIFASIRCSPIENSDFELSRRDRTPEIYSIEIVGCRSCPYKIGPVCGEDGYTYDNDCLAKCAEAKILRYGPCVSLRGNCECNLEWDPVCGEDGKTYYNMCDVECLDVTVVHEGQCEIDPDDCTCANVPPDLVCGDDGKTYESPCELKCAGAEIEKTGECEDGDEDSEEEEEDEE